MNIVILQRHDSAADAAGCRDFVTGLQVVQHGLPLLLSALLRQDHHHVQKSDENNGDEKSAAERARAAARLQQHETVYMHLDAGSRVQNRSRLGARMAPALYGPLRW